MMRKKELVTHIAVLLVICITVLLAAAAVAAEIVQAVKKCSSGNLADTILTETDCIPVAYSVVIQNDDIDPYGCGQSNMGQYAAVSGTVTEVLYPENSDGGVEFLTRENNGGENEIRYMNCGETEKENTGTEGIAGKGYVSCERPL